MQLFYLAQIEEDFLISGEEVKHIRKVLRKNIGDSIQITDGKGKGFHAEIREFTKNNIACSLGKEIINELELPVKVHLAVAPTKNIDRFEWMIEKAVELGVNEITPIIGNHSERKIVNLERLQKVAISAMKQSGRFVLPTIHEAIDFKNFKTSDICYFAHCREEKKSDLTKEIIKNNCAILIGPEGDFSVNEIEECLKRNYIPISLGETRLRTETAAIYAMSILKAKA